MGWAPAVVLFSYSTWRQGGWHDLLLAIVIGLVMSVLASYYTGRRLPPEQP